MEGKLNRLGRCLVLGSGLLACYATLVAAKSGDLLAFVFVGTIALFGWCGIVSLLRYLLIREPEFNLDLEPHPNRFVQMVLDDIQAEQTPPTDRIIGEHSRQCVLASNPKQGREKKDSDRKDKEWAEMTRLL